MAGIPKRAKSAEQALIGAHFSLSSFEIAANELKNDFVPLTDMRASAKYRELAAANMFKRFFLEQGQQHAVVLI
jgi:xanthine dehydrogenase small subunit